jgi:hypothetical protein
MGPDRSDNLAAGGTMAETNRELWDRVDAQHMELFRRGIEQQKKRGPAERDYAEAVDAAKRYAEQAELFPRRTDDGELRYTVRQGLQAACQGREDAAAVLLVQLPILKRLDRIRGLLWACAGLLAYIAYRVS